MLLLPPQPPPPSSLPCRFLPLAALLLLFASLSLSIHLPSPFPILSVSSTREGRIADVFTIVVSLDRKVRRGCRYRACSLPISFLRAPSCAPRPFLPPSFSPSILSRSFLIVARTENPKSRGNSAIFDICRVHPPRTLAFPVTRFISSIRVLIVTFNFLSLAQCTPRREKR